jgi:hypothetical protein
MTRVSRGNPNEAEVKLKDLLEASIKLDDVSFPKRFPEPALVFDARSPESGDPVHIDTPDEGHSLKNTSTLSLKDVKLTDWKSTDAFPVPTGVIPSPSPSPAPPPTPRSAEADAVVVFLTKTNRNPFAGMITVGRTRNNDICLPLGSISKLHAYFVKKPGSDAWSITDQNATNGTIVDGFKLPSGGSAELHDGSRIGFGPDVFARYYTPAGLFGYLALSRAGL